jgi:hypothetical protein
MAHQRPALLRPLAARPDLPSSTSAAGCVCGCMIALWTRSSAFKFFWRALFKIQCPAPNGTRRVTMPQARARRNRNYRPFTVLAQDKFTPGQEPVSARALQTPWQVVLMTTGPDSPRRREFNEFRTGPPCDADAADESGLIRGASQSNCAGSGSTMPRRGSLRVGIAYVACHTLSASWASFAALHVSGGMATPWSTCMSWAAGFIAISALRRCVPFDARRKRLCLPPGFGSGPACSVPRPSSCRGRSDGLVAARRTPTSFSQTRPRAIRRRRRAPSLFPSLPTMVPTLSVCAVADVRGLHTAKPRDDSVSSQRPERSWEVGAA